MSEKRRQRSRWLRYFFCGILIGAGAILPGVSGGVLAVVFDIYRPFMEVLTRPRKALPLRGSARPRRRGAVHRARALAL